MNPIKLRDFLFKDRPGEEIGQRAEALITQGLALTVTLLAVFAFRSPAVLAASVITNLVGIFVIAQTIRGKFNYLILFPAVTAGSICVAAIFDGKGSYDLIWAGTIGLFLLANVYSRKDAWPTIGLGALMIALFIGTGMAEMNGFLPDPYGTDKKHILLGVLYLSSMMGAMAAVFQRHRALLAASTKSREEERKARQQFELINRQLDSQVKTRTEELRNLYDQLAEKAARLQAASDISQELTGYSNENTSQFLARAARTISEKLGYYHVGVFLLDTARGYAILQAANSKGGQQMLANRHQLKVGGAGIVGYVSQSGRPRIALDAGADAVFFNNPYLPETRSEISLPIKAGNAIVGVLDVQSTQPAAFNEEDTSILMSIANQIALLLRRSESGFAAAASWRGAQAAGSEKGKRYMGYTFHPDGSVLSNTAMESNSSMEKSIHTGEIVTGNLSRGKEKPHLTVPVRFRDQVIGVIHIESEGLNRLWSDDELLLVQSISDRAALALENARLFEDATRRAEQEGTISKVTTLIGSSTDFERILQTAVQELGIALGASRSFIKLGLQDSDGKDSE